MDFVARKEQLIDILRKPVAHQRETLVERLQVVFLTVANVTINRNMVLMILI